MTTKTISGAYPSGYTLAASISTLSIASTGLVEGNGVNSTHPATVANFGTVDLYGGVIAGGTLSGAGLAVLTWPEAGSYYDSADANVLVVCVIEEACALDEIDEIAGIFWETKK